MDLLGDTLQKIAAEKAGIIKKGVPVLIGETCSDTMEIFLEKALSAGSSIHFADRLYQSTLDEGDFHTGKRSFEIINFKNRKVINGITSLGGDYQEKNIPVVAAAADLLEGVFNISESHVLKGIENVTSNTGLLGRWQILGTTPLVICDTGHNKEGIRYVLAQLTRIPAKSLHMVLGFVNDKDLSLVLPLFPENAKYYFTKADVPRALDETILMQKASEAGLHGESYNSVASALESARRCANDDDLIFIGGSTFVVAEVV
jgi:dihydrofolate synthase/folylpolyglutamate synthase